MIRIVKTIKRVFLTHFEINEHQNSTSNFHSYCNLDEHMTAHQRLCNMAGKISKVAVAYVTSCCGDEHVSVGSGRRPTAGVRPHVDKL
jgi:hypothetical protein